MTDAISYNDLMKKDIPPVEYLVKDIIPKAGLVYLFGPPGAFKTNFLLYVSMLGADGQNIFEFQVKRPFKTLWIDEENRDIGMKNKITKIKNGIKLNDMTCLDGNYVVISSGFSLIDEKYIIWLKDVIKRYKPNMVVMDSVAKIYPLDERNEKEVKIIFKLLCPLIMEFGVTFVLIHHSRKLNIQQTSIKLEDIAGSREFGAMADSVLVIDEKKTRGEYILKQVKNRYEKKVCCVDFTVSGDDNMITVAYQGTTKEKISFKKKAEQCAEELLKWRAETGITKFPRKDAIDEMWKLGFKETNIDNGIALLLQKKNLKAVDRGEYEWIS